MRRLIIQPGETYTITANATTRVVGDFEAVQGSAPAPTPAPIPAPTPAPSGPAASLGNGQFARRDVIINGAAPTVFDFIPTNDGGYISIAEMTSGSYPVRMEISATPGGPAIAMQEGSQITTRWTTVGRRGWAQLQKGQRYYISVYNSWHTGQTRMYMQGGVQ